MGWSDLGRLRGRVLWTHVHASRSPTHCGTLGSPVCGYTYVFPIALLFVILVAYHLMNQYEALHPPQVVGRP
jgi:hypothetical protein